MVYDTEDVASGGGSGIFNTETASLGPQGYDSLEDRIFNWDWRESDALGENQDAEPARKPLRVRKWQHNTAGYIKEETGSNYADIYRCAYAEGVSEITDVFDKSEADDFRDAVSMFFWIKGSYQHTKIDRVERDVKSDIDDIPDPMGSENYGKHGELTDLVNLTLLPNHLSAISGDYEEDYNFGPWVHRAVVSLGLGNSILAPQSSMSYVEDVREWVPRAFYDSRAKFEDNVGRYFRRELEYWIQNGVHEDFLKDMRCLLEYLTDGSRRTIGLIYQELNQNAEILNSEDSGYTRYENRPTVDHLK